MGMFSQNELFLMIGVVGSLLTIIFILTIFDIKDYLKSKKESIEEDEEIELGEKLKPEEVEPKVEDAIEVLEVNEKEEVLISDIEIKNEEPFIEEENVVMPSEAYIEEEEVTPKEEIVQKVNVQEELNKALETLPNEVDSVTKFEEEQERTAIISLDELLKKSDDLYNDNEIVQYDDGNEPISIDEVINMFNKNNEVEKSVPEVMQDIVEEKEVYTHKETIPFISSVYGIEKNNNSLEFENTATYEKLSRNANNEFMAKLREMNENK